MGDKGRAHRLRRSVVVVSAAVVLVGLSGLVSPVAAHASTTASIDWACVSRPRGIEPTQDVYDMTPWVYQANKACTSTSTSTSTGTGTGTSTSTGGINNFYCAECDPPLDFTPNTPVMGSATGTPGDVTITPIFWKPPGYHFYGDTTYDGPDPNPDAYTQTLDSFFSNVAAADGSTTNVFSTMTEYYQQMTGGPRQYIKYDIHAGTPLTVTTPFPTATSTTGCTVSPQVPPAGPGPYTACVTNGAIMREISATIAANSLTANDANLYVMYLPYGVASCLDPGVAPVITQPPTGDPCSTNYFCGYHAGFNYNNTQQPVVYADIPYSTQYCFGPGQHNPNQYPNGSYAVDPAISTTTHEIIESITDWAGAWHDAAGNEMADECAWIYGSVLGYLYPSTTSPIGGYNQVINGGHYFIQTMFSNWAYAVGQGTASDLSTGGVVKGCIQRPIPPPVVGASAPTTVTSGQATLNGTVDPGGSTTTYVFQYGTSSSYGHTAPATPVSAGSGTAAVTASTVVSGLTPNTTYDVRLVATNSVGTIDGAMETFTTPPPPPTATTGAATSLTPTGATLNGTVNPGGAATTYVFQYGTSSSYGHTAPATPVSAGSGTTTVTASTAVSGLTPNTTYDVRLVATDAGGSTDGAMETFTTPPAPPTATTGTATNLTPTGATLRGTINPGGAATTYVFQYISTASSRSPLITVPATPVSAGSGTTTVTASTAVSGFTPNTTYVVTLVAKNRLGTASGGAQLLTTPGQTGYSLASDAGNVWSFGTRWDGSPIESPGGTGGAKMVAIAADGNGYLVLKANGGVDNFAAAWYGSEAGKLPRGVTAVGIATDPSTGGYWLLTSDGGVFDFNAPWFGSPKAEYGAANGVAIAADGAGYAVLRANGGVDTYGVPWDGSVAGRLPPGVMVVGIG